MKNKFRNTIPSDSIYVELEYIAPYNWDLMMGFFSSRVILGQQISVKAASTLAWFGLLMMF